MRAIVSRYLNQVVNMDCIEFLRMFPDNCVDAVVTDPPYFLLNDGGKGFMGQEWDSIGEAHWSRKELVRIVELFFALIAIDSSMVVESTVQEPASIRASHTEREHVSKPDALSVESQSREDQAQSKANNNSVQGIVLTKVEVLDTLNELLPDLTGNAYLKHLNENVLFAVPLSLLERRLRSIAPERVSRSVIESLCKGQEIRLTSTAEARIKGAIEGLIGNGYEDLSMREMNGYVSSAESIAVPMRFRHIISKNGECHKTIQWIISSLYVLVVMPKFTMEEQIYRWHKRWATEVLRVLKHGGHILAMGGTRTYHRLACAIEDAGFICRDTVDWVYGQGFSKGMNVSKAIDKSIGVDSVIVGINPSSRKSKVVGGGGMDRMNKDNRGYMRPAGVQYITRPSTTQGQEWEGWYTQLKPAHEPIVLAQKPFKGTVIDNLLEWGVGALNIDDCRITVNPDVDAIGKTTKRKRRDDAAVFNEESCGYDNPNNPMAGVLPSGRFPSNFILSHHPECRQIQDGTIRVTTKRRERTQHMGQYGIYGEATRSPVEYGYEGMPEIWECHPDCPVRILNEQSGKVGAGSPPEMRQYDRKRPRLGGHDIYGRSDDGGVFGYGDQGGAARFFFTCQMDNDSRFFYCAKASPAERNAGLDAIYTFRPRNLHITVKPIALMRYLIRLITPKGGIVLDPFLGSGTTAIAAQREGMQWLGCDIDKEYCLIAKTRIKALGRPDPDDRTEQTTLRESD